MCLPKDTTILWLFVVRHWCYYYIISGRERRVKFLEKTPVPITSPGPIPILTPSTQTKLGFGEDNVWHHSGALVRHTSTMLHRRVQRLLPPSAWPNTTPCHWLHLTMTRSRAASPFHASSPPVPYCCSSVVLILGVDLLPRARKLLSFASPSSASLCARMYKID